MHILFVMIDQPMYCLINWVPQQNDMTRSHGALSFSFIGAPLLRSTDVPSNAAENAAADRGRTV